MIRSHGPPDSAEKERRESLQRPPGPDSAAAGGLGGLTVWLRKNRLVGTGFPLAHMMTLEHSTGFLAHFLHPSSPSFQSSSGLQNSVQINFFQEAHPDKPPQPRLPRCPTSHPYNCAVKPPEDRQSGELSCGPADGIHVQLHQPKENCM